MTKSDLAANAYNPTFQWRFLSPKYWGIWLALLVGVPISLLPKRWHIAMARLAAKYLAQKRRGTVRNIWVNLSLCFPEKSDAEKQKIVQDCLTTAGAFLLSFPRISLLGRRYLESHSEIQGLEHLEAVRARGDNVILLTPHTWAIDVLPILLAAKGSPVVAMVKQQKNPVADWLMHRQRMQFDTSRIFERSAGIKPYMKSIREGYLGYYLPDQDHGRELSVFSHFFATEKATLPGLGKLAKLSRAKVVPCFTRFDLTTGRYHIDIYPEWHDFPSNDDAIDTRRMNAYLEQVLTEHLEQYMWIFQLLRTRPDPDEISPYKDPKWLN
ncbi:lipid A biosynthesis (KDO)2-(lauroyl)-lipid IVA acyltransferase [Vibrio sp. SM6]|uniref:Lipid A biosynthesis acyltransferase n=1 Tax=Vibrio agarilyticus TaxID=2726741 RepID=A0A7X8TRL9_9VIBR|nr:lipid A biosynthesis (KDO)2-(lauroyl)-lipid IVA acyltransferase [Vibrio agarilyticus]NLS13551.1 lipid A biosynthesis (KDO)2-(lauroyl)-lipid IVA acyltransferase [Vibrio agarilyticus]